MLDDQERHTFEKLFIVPDSSGIISLILQIKIMLSKM